MIYRNNDISLWGVEDRYKTGDYGDYDEYEEDKLVTRCDICGEDIYDDETYYSNGEINKMNMCCTCYDGFYKVY